MLRNQSRSASSSSEEWRLVRVDRDALRYLFHAVLYNLYQFGEGILPMWMLGNVIPGSRVSVVCKREGQTLSDVKIAVIDVWDPKTRRPLMEILYSPYRSSELEYSVLALSGALSGDDVQAILDEMLDAVYTVYLEVLAYANEDPSVKIDEYTLSSYAEAAEALASRGARVHPRVSLHAGSLIRELTLNNVFRKPVGRVKGELMYPNTTKYTWEIGEGAIGDVEYEWRAEQEYEWEKGAYSLRLTFEVISPYECALLLSTVLPGPESTHTGDVLVLENPVLPLNVEWKQGKAYEDDDDLSFSNELIIDVEIPEPEVVEHIVTNWRQLVSRALRSYEEKRSATRRTNEKLLAQAWRTIVEKWELLSSEDHGHRGQVTNA
ncbi:MAG: hypothetical protein QXF05_04565 [Thermofilaceae archaeon]